jgi:hypothetical protein
MTFTMRLERAAGKPADPPTLRTAVPNWSPRDTIFLGRRSFAWSQFETTTSTKRRCWLLKHLHTRH